MIRTPLSAVFAIVAGCALAFVTPLADPGAALLPLVAAVSVATAVAGVGWGLLAFAIGIACAAWLLAPVTVTAAQLPLVLYALVALTLFATVATLRARIISLNRRNRLLDARVDALDEAVLAVDADERVVQMNRAAERLTGWRASDAHGKPLAQVLRYTTLPEVPTAEAGVPDISDGSLRAAGTLVARGDGERLITPLAASVPPPAGDNGRVILLRDVTDWQRAERRLRALIGELWTASRRKDDAIVALSLRGSADPCPAAAAPTTSTAVSAAPAAGPAASSSVAGEPDTQPFQAAIDATPDDRVLMLCDDSDSAFALSMLLGMAGYDVKTAASAPEAVQHAARFAPQVVLIDTTMHDTDGCVTARLLRSVCAGSELVALTNPEQVPDRDALAAAGYTLAISKSEPLTLKRWLATRRAA